MVQIHGSVICDAECRMHKGKCTNETQQRRKWVLANQPIQASTHLTNMLRASRNTCILSLPSLPSLLAGRLSAKHRQQQQSLAPSLSCEMRLPLYCACTHSCSKAGKHLDSTTIGTCNGTALYNTTKQEQRDRISDTGRPRAKSQPY